MAEDERILECPACHKRLAKVRLESVNMVVDICIDGCGGIFFNNKEMPAVISSAEAFEEIKKLCEGKEFKKVDESDARECPFCGSNMVKNFTSYSKDVQIDECYRCGGKFLDNGELQKIKIQDTEHDTDAMMNEVKAMFEEDLKETTGRNVVFQNNTPRNKRRSFFINLANKFFNR